MHWRPALKKNYTMRRRLNIGPFNNQLFKYLTDKSCSYLKISYATEPFISIQEWSKAIVWAKEKKLNSITKDTFDNIQEIFIPSSKFIEKYDRKLITDDVEQYESFVANNFDEFWQCEFFISLTYFFKLQIFLNCLQSLI